MSCISPGSVFDAAFSAAFTGMLHRGCANSQRGEDIGVDNRRYVRRRVSGLSIEAHSHGPGLQVRLRPPGRWIFLPARGIWRRASRRGEAGLAHRRRDRSFDRTATVRCEGNRPLSGRVKMDDARQRAFHGRRFDRPRRMPRARSNRLQSRASANARSPAAARAPSRSSGRRFSTTIGTGRSSPVSARAIEATRRRWSGAFGGREARREIRRESEPGCGRRRLAAAGARTCGALPLTARRFWRRNWPTRRRRSR